MAALVSSISKPGIDSVSLPPAVWRADQMGSYQAAVTSTGHRALDDELPHRGWPSAALIDRWVSLRFTSAPPIPPTTVK